MNFPTFESCKIPNEIKDKIKGLISDYFDGESQIQVSDLSRFLIDYINPLYKEFFGEQLPELIDKQLEETVSRYNESIQPKSSFNINGINLEWTRQTIELFIQGFFIKKIVSNKLNEIKPGFQAKEKTYPAGSNHPVEIECVLINLGDNKDRGPKSPPILPSYDYRNEADEKIKLDLNKLDKDHAILQSVLFVFQGKTRFNVGRHELHDGKIIVTIKEEEIFNGVNRSTLVDYQLVYDYGNPSKYTNFQLLAALTLEGKTVNIDPRNRNAILRQQIKLYTV